MKLTMNEAGALRYDWFLDEKEEVCVVQAGRPG